MTLRISTPAVEGVYQGSKYLKYQVLCDKDELESLFSELQPCSLFLLSGLTDGNPIKISNFIQEYGSWIEGLKSGVAPVDSQLRTILAAGLTLDTDALWKQEVPGNRFLVKIANPVIQIQAHFFTYSPIDGVFRPNSMGQNSIFWGLQFSFPQIYQDPKTMELLEIDQSPNLELFQKIKQWVRDFTRPTPFVVGDKKTNVPIRLGKSSFSWIHMHPQLTEQKISVYAG